jgi:hypothetical protein
LGIFAVYPADGSAGVLVGGSGYGAGIQHDNLSFRQLGGAIESSLLELPFDGGSVSLGRATTKILYVKTRHDTIVAAQADPEDQERILLRRACYGRCPASLAVSIYSLKDNPCRVCCWWMTINRCC